MCRSAPITNISLPTASISAQLTPPRSSPTWSSISAITASRPMSPPMRDTAVRRTTAGWKRSRSAHTSSTITSTVTKTGTSGAKSPIPWISWHMTRTGTCITAPAGNRWTASEPGTLEPARGSARPSPYTGPAAAKDALYGHSATSSREIVSYR